MTIDEAIKKYKCIANTDSSCPRYCMLPCEECVQECGQVADWLEELKAYKQKPEGWMRDGAERKGYNKALDNFANACKENIMCKTFGLRECDIEQIAEQLKVGGENGNI